MSDQMTLANTPLAPISFTLTDAETPAEDLILLGSSSNTNLVPDENLVFNGNSTNRALFVFPAPDSVGTTLITVTALDSVGAETSQSFTLSVLPATTVSLKLERIDTEPPPLKIERVDHSNGSLRLQFNAEPGLPYSVEYCDSLTADSWLALTNIAPLQDGGLIEVSDSIAGRPHRFYRLSTPASAQSAQVAAASGRVSLYFTAQPGLSYTVEYCDSLATGSWHTLTNVRPVSVESTVTVSDDGVTQPQRFYRLRVP